MKFVRNINTRLFKRTLPGSKKLSIFSVATLVLVSSLATVLSPMLTSQAAAVSAGEMKQKADVWLGISGALDGPGSLKDNISAADANSCNFYVEGIGHGPHLTSGNLASVGMTCPEMLKALGYSPPSGTQGTYKKSSPFNKNSMLNALSASGFSSQNAFYGGDLRAGVPSDAIAYTIAIGLLEGKCSASFRTELLNPIPPFNGDPANDQRVNWMHEGGTQNTPLNDDRADSDTNYHFWMWTYRDGKASKNIYYAGDTMDDYFDVGYGANFLSGYQTGPRDAGLPYQVDCYQAGRLLQDNDKYAKAYAAVLKPGSSATPGTCEDKYGAGTATMNACVQGFAHKGDTSFCINTFEAGALRDACEYGRKTATGTTGVTPPADDEAVEAAEDKTTCAIVGVGWILCPIVTFLSQIVDAAYAFVSSLLFVQPLFSTADSNTVGVYNAWSTMRNFANIAFVMAFLVIIYSQLTGVGITNYGIKKMLPKLIIAAILVNVSYWVCAIAIDLSNILGGSINGLLKGIGEGGLVAGPNAAEFGATGQNWAGITAFILAGGALLATGTFFVALAALLPALISVLTAIIVTLLILTIRQGLLILLIVVSPLAFVAFLLPNTSSIFKKWRDLFQTLLIMYPIISLIFGASALASVIIMNSASGTYQIAIQIMGAVVAILPLLIVPALIKAATGVLNKFGLGGFISGVNLNGVRKKAEDYRDYRKDVAKGQRIKRAGNIMEGDGKGLGGQYSRRRRVAAFLATGGATSGIDRDKKRGFAKAATEEGSQQYFAKRALNQEGFAEGIAGDAAQGLKASAQSAVDKILRQDIENREILLTADVKYKDNPQAALNDALKKGDGIQASAAMNMLMKTGAGGFDKIHDSLAKAEKDPGTSAAVMDRMRDHVKTNGQTIKGKDPSLTAWASQGGAKSLDQVASDASSFNKSDAELVGFSPKAFQEAASRGLIDQARAQAMKANQSLFKDASPANKAIIEAIAAGGPPPPPPPR